MQTRASSFNVSLWGRGPWREKAFYLGIFIALSVLYAYRSDYNLATGMGNLSMLLFLAANIYFPAKRIRFRYKIQNVQPCFDKLLIYHIWLNTFSFVAAVIHCYITPWSNKWLIASLFIMGWLTFGGFLMWSKYPPGKIKKGVYILHTQQLLFFVMIFALLKGHYVF